MRRETLIFIYDLFLIHRNLDLELNFLPDRTSFIKKTNKYCGRWNMDAYCEYMAR